MKTATILSKAEVGEDITSSSLSICMAEVGREAEGGEWEMGVCVARRERAYRQVYGGLLTTHCRK